MSRCPDRPTLAAYVGDTLDTEQATAVESHVGRCRRCAAGLAAILGEADLVREIRGVEESRRQIATALSQLPELEKRIATTLFGERGMAERGGMRGAGAE